MTNNIHSIANVYELVKQMKDLTDNQILDKFYKELLWGKKDYQILASCQDTYEHHP